MPTKGTTRRSIRCEDELWDAAKTKAQEEGTNLSDVIRDALKAYVGDRDTATKVAPSH